MPTESTSLNPPYLETPEEMREEMIGPTEGITEGHSEIE